MSEKPADRRCHEFPVWRTRIGPGHSLDFCHRFHGASDVRLSQCQLALKGSCNPSEQIFFLAVQCWRITGFQHDDVYLAAKASLIIHQLSPSDDMIVRRKPISEKLCPILFPLIASGSWISSCRFPYSRILSVHLCAKLMHVAMKVMVHGRIVVAA